jgi:F-type H+-transporting ATPase subunit c
MKASKGLKWIMLVVAVAVVALGAQQALAAGPEGPGTEAKAAAPSDIGKGLAVLGCCIGAAFAAAGGGMAIARIGTACLESIARQPEATGQLFSPMIITAAMVEGCILFAIVIALMGILK